MKEKDVVGLKGEVIAQNFLKNKKYKIIENNFSCKFGEIDIIAKDKDCIVFVEVKTRESFVFGEPQESVTYTKQQKIKKTAELYLLNKKLVDVNYRFDVVSINDKDIIHYEDAFN